MPQETGSRFNEGKPKWSLVDFSSLEDMVSVLNYGATKYAPYNWKKGLKTTEICESMLRHIYEYLEGENKDHESQCNIVGHIMCNAMFLSYMMKYKPDFDDRFIDKNKHKNKTIETL